MLVPAILYKEEIEKEFAKELYTDNYFYYSGYAHCHSLLEIKAEDHVYQYAIVDNDKKLIGFLGYRIDADTDSINSFGLYSFDKGNCIIGKTYLKKWKNLLKDIEG